MRSARVALLLAVAALGALGGKLWLASTTLGTSDVRAFQFFLRAYLGSGAETLYAVDPKFNHPPFVLQILLGVRWLVQATGLPFPFCLRLPGILADLGSILVLLALFAPDRSRGTRTVLVLVAAAPVSILVSGFHGNTDAIMVFLVLLSVWLAQGPRRTVLAGAAMGLAVSVKIVPLLLGPAVLFWLPDRRRRLEYAGAAALVAIAAASPTIFEAPGLLLRKVLGYSGSFGLWGVSRLATLSPAISEAFEHGGRWVLLAVLLGLSAWMNLRGRKPSLYRQLGVLTTAFLAFAPAFGPQYLVWIVPFLVGLPVAAVAAFLAVSGAFLVLVYTFWSQGVEQDLGVTDWRTAEFWRMGLPWHYANADQLGPWRGEIVPVEIACWVAVVVLFALQMRAARREGEV